MAKKINMDSWHFKLYKKMAEHYIFDNQPHHVNRCKYLKGVLRGIGWQTLKTLGYMFVVTAMALGPFGIFFAFMDAPGPMLTTTVIFLWILLSWAAIKIKRKIERYSSRFDTVRKFDDGFISLEDLIVEFFRGIKDHLCPIWVAVPPNYQENVDIQIKATDVQMAAIRGILHIKNVELWFLTKRALGQSRNLDDLSFSEAASVIKCGDELPLLRR